MCQKFFEKLSCYEFVNVVNKSMILNGPGHMTFLTFDTYVDSIISLVHPSGDQWYILLEAIEADPLLPLRPQSLWPQQETHLSLGNANGNIHYSKGKTGGSQLLKAL